MLPPALRAAPLLCCCGCSTLLSLIVSCCGPPHLCSLRRCRAWPACTWGVPVALESSPRLNGTTIARASPRLPSRARMFPVVEGLLLVCALDGSTRSRHMRPARAHSRATTAAVFFPAAPLPATVTSWPPRARARAPAINSLRLWVLPVASV